MLLLLRAPGRDMSVSWEEHEPEPEPEPEVGLSCGRTYSDFNLHFHKDIIAQKNRQVNVQVHPKVSLFTIRLNLDISATDRPGTGPVLQHIGSLVTPLLTH